MICLPRPRGTDGRVLVLLLAAGMLSLFVARPATVSAKDDRDEVRVAAVCGRGATAELRLKNGDNGIELRLKLDHSRAAAAAWRVALVHERRVAWKGVGRTTRAKRSFELKQTLTDLPGSDTVTARALGPQGLVCRATATLPARESEPAG